MFSVNRRDFGPNFVFGTATSSYQIEGGQTDGRGMATWDTFAATPGNVKGTVGGEVADDHYNRWPEDLDLIRDAGFDAYRFSFAWPRLIPEGTGAVNQAGIDFYDRLIDGMLERNLKPFGTIYHWDLPSPLQDKGGWMNRDIAGWFADYARLIAQKFGDRLYTTATINEPWCVAFLSHYLGVHAPGYRDVRAAARAMPCAARARHRHRRPACGGDKEPRHRPQPRKGRAAAGPRPMRARPKWATRSSTPGTSAACSRAPIPRSSPPHWRGGCPPTERDMETVAAPTRLARHQLLFPRPLVANPKDTVFGMGRGEGAARNQRPQLGDLPAGADRPLGARVARLHQDPDLRDRERHVGGRRHAPGRFLRPAPGRAGSAAAGADVRGYFSWSLIDNFEWGEGYTSRFGIVHVDYETQRRTPKGTYRAFQGMLHNTR